MKFLDQRGFTSDVRAGQTVHFTEMVKKNALKVLKILFMQPEGEGLSKQHVFEVLVKHVRNAIEIYNKPIELDENKQPKITQKEKKTINEKQIKATTYGLKAIEEIMHAFLSESETEKVKEFITCSINKIVEVTAIACE